MVEVSLCMIVKNEEDVLGRCLESVKGLVEEIIIVDTGSTDQTKSIARQYTEKIYDFAWCDDFSAARNESFAKATKDYIIWLDADDLLLQEDAAAFLNLKQTLDPAIDLVMMKYNVAFDPFGRPTFSYYRERLMRRDRGYRWLGAVHEVIPPAGKIIYSQVAVTHRKEHPTDPDRNLRIFEKMLEQKKPLDARQQYYYARELYYHERYEEAVKKFEQFLNSCDGWVENKINACLDLAECLKKMQQEEDILPTLMRSFLFDEPRAEICCAIGAQFMEQERWKQAIFWYQLAANCKQNSLSGGFLQPDCYDFIPYMQLCVCFDRLGDKERSREYHEMAKSIKPQDAAVLYNEQYFYQETAAQ